MTKEELWDSIDWKTIAVFTPLWGLALLIIIGSCFKGSAPPPPRAPGVYVTNQELLLVALPSNAVIVAVNGEAMTRHDFDVAQSLYAKIFFLQQPSRSVLECLRLASAFEGRIINNFIRHTLFRQEAARRGIEPDAGVLAETIARMLDEVNRADSTLEAVAAEIGGEQGALFHSFVTGSARDRTLVLAVEEDARSMSEEELGHAYRRLAWRLHGEAVVEYPHGTNIFNRAVSSRRPRLR